MKRPETFEQIIGNKNKIEFLRNSIKQGEMPDMLLLTGPEGIGKTSLAKLLACEFVNASNEDREAIIKENKDTKNIKSYRMSLDSSIENIRAMLDLLKSDFIGASVIILDECHCMPNHVMDALLTDSEYIPKNKKIILCTTDRNKLSKQLLSRTFIMYLNPPTKDEMRKLIKQEIFDQNITLENENLFLELLLNKYPKPRSALKLIQAIGFNRRLSVSEYDIFIEYEDSSIYKDLLLSLDNSIIASLVLIEKIESIDQLILFIKAVLTYRLDNKSIYSPTELLACQNVPKETLLRFLEALSKTVVFSNETNQNKLMYSVLYATGKLETAHKISKATEEVYTSRQSTFNFSNNDISMMADLESLIADGIRVED